MEVVKKYIKQLVILEMPVHVNDVLLHTAGNSQQKQNN
jgi:hypothetical protein